MVIGIVGLGIIGRACEYGFKKLGHKVKGHDILLDTKLSDLIDSEIIYICVPTPSSDDGSCDTSIVESVIHELNETLNYKGIIAIKSTTEPGTTSKLISKYKSDICFVPEFLRERCAISDFTENHDLLAIGTYSDNVFEKIKECHGHYPKQIVKITPTEAELLKYYSNMFNALRITFANEMYEICRKLEADYNSIKNAFMLRKTAADIYMDVNENFRGFGGMCVTPETKIYANGTTIAAEKIKINDTVLTIDGSWQKIQKIYTRDINEEILNIKGQGLDGFNITKGHKIFAIKANRNFYGKKRFKLSNYLNKEYNFEWINSDELSKGDFIAMPASVFKNNTINGITPELARLFGYYASEGSLDKGRNKQKNRICLTFNSDESEYHKDIENIIKTHYNQEVFYRIKGNTCTIRFTNNKLSELLKTHINEYSHAKTLSEEFINLPDEYLIEFLKGYFRGDGSISCDKISVTTVSEKLFYQIKLLLLRFKISFVTITKNARIDKNKINHKKSYTIRISNYNDILNFQSIIDFDIIKNLKLQRKTSFFENDLMIIPIKEINKFNYSGTVYNFHVENNNTYVVADAIVHNCLPKDTLAMDALCKKLNLDLKLFEAICQENKKFKITVLEGMRP